MSELEVFAKEYVIFDDTIQTKEECLKRFSEHAVTLQIGDSQEALLEGFLHREKECTTGFGDGFAIPHTRCDAVKKAGVLVLKNKNGMEWEAMDGEPVYVAIALLVPGDEAGALHMKLLSSLSRKLMNKEFKENLFQAEDAETVYSVLAEALRGN